MRENRPYEDTRSIYAKQPPTVPPPQPALSPLGADSHSWQVTHIDCPFRYMLKWVLKLIGCFLIIQICFGVIMGVFWLILFAIGVSIIAPRIPPPPAAMPTWPTTTFQPPPSSPPQYSPRNFGKPTPQRVLNLDAAAPTPAPDPGRIFTDNPLSRSIQNTFAQELEKATRPRPKPTPQRELNIKDPQ